MLGRSRSFCAQNLLLTNIGKRLLREGMKEDKIEGVSQKEGAFLRSPTGQR